MVIICVHFISISVLLLLLLYIWCFYIGLFVLYVCIFLLFLVTFNLIYHVFHVLVLYLFIIFPFLFKQYMKGRVSLVISTNFFLMIYTLNLRKPKRMVFNMLSICCPLYTTKAPMKIKIET